ncbi:MAG: FadR family transcriptional regulator [Chloroflexi bacterium]|nr:FadR family transcriptional regulator [Chloroflexota bacterium]
MLDEPEPRDGAAPDQPRARGFSSLASERLWARVAREIRHAVLDGRYQPGDRLPSEKALAEQFGVSRNVVREALKGLESVGLLQMRRGAAGGAFVRRASPRLLNQALYTLLRLEGSQVSNLHEARLLLEPAIAAIAAERATPLGVAELERSIARSEAILRASQPMTPALDLHLLLARMTGNPVLELLVGLMTDLLETSRQRHPSLIDTSREAGAEVIDHHRTIMAAIAERDPERSRALMRAHLVRISEMDRGTL